MKKKWFILIMLMFVMVGCIGFIKGDSNVQFSTWIWDAESLEKKGDQYIQFANEHKVSKLFVQVNEDVSNEHYADFIDKASKNNIEVYALGGSKSWVFDDKKVDKFLAWVERFQQQYGKLAGVHVDIEPYLLDQWDTDQGAVVLAYFDTLSTIQAFAEKQELTFEVDMPFWFNKVSYDNSYGKGNVSEWVIDIADNTTLMAYRNKAEGRNGIIRLVEDELVYAEAQRKQITIAVETYPSKEGEHISFAGKSNEQLTKVLQQVINQYDHNDALSGIAVHHLESWQQIK
ncbi:hypothetical protein [Lysinibacillus sp. 54212]|uniref:hypothetical protein n=1 Tax=Lysinibacillus sp. 54212 TaxID=3119829 RepID=UPI002FC58AE8